MQYVLQAYSGAQSEVEMLKKEVAKQTSRAEQCTSLRNQLEKQTFELQQATSKLKELEYERDSYKDWQQQAKVGNCLINFYTIICTVKTNYSMLLRVIHKHLESTHSF